MRKTRNLLAGGESVTTTVTFSINNCLVCLYSAYATALGVRCVYNFKQMLEFSKTAEPTTFESHLVVCVGNFRQRNQDFSYLSSPRISAFNALAIFCLG